MIEASVRGNGTSDKLRGEQAKKQSRRATTRREPGVTITALDTTETEAVNAALQ